MVCPFLETHKAQPPVHSILHACQIVVVYNAWDSNKELGVYEHAHNSVCQISKTTIFTRKKKKDFFFSEYTGVRLTGLQVVLNF